MNLLDKVIEEQRKGGLSDRSFARQLGVSQALWTNTRRGKVPLGLKVLAGIAREFPRLGNEILKHLVATAPRNLDQSGQQKQS